MAEETDRAMYEARVYDEQLRLLEGEIERISMTTVELSNSLRSIEGLKQEAIFVPIGGGAMINASVNSTEVLVPIGGGYMMNLKKHEAIEEIKKRIASTETATVRLRSEFTKISAKLQEINEKLGAMAASQGRRR